MMNTDLLHDIISAGISTLFAILITGIGRLITNRDAFFHDVFYPIIKKQTPQKSIKCIKKRKKLYSYCYRFPGSKRIKKLIDNYESTIAALVSKDKVFKDAIMDYYFAKIGEERYVKTYDNKKGDYIIHDRADSYDLSYCSNEYEFGVEYSPDALEALINALEMYSHPEGGLFTTSFWFNDISVNKIIEESEYFTKYIKAQDDYDCARIALEKIAPKRWLFF